MGLFSRVRRTAAAQAADPSSEHPAEQPAATAPEAAGDEPDAGDIGEAPAVASIAASAPAPRPGGAGLSTLRDSLQQLYAIRPSRDAFAEEAIKLIARATSAKAAALLGYEQRGGRMSLAAHVGLESDAVHVLSGDAMMSAWDIPLRSIRNRRINVIEAAHENPFVPRPLAAISPRRLTIAALPFFHANTPVGAVVLFSPTPRGFADGVLKTLSQALRICALALSELPPSAAATARAVEEEASPSQPTLLRGLAALKSELARLTSALEESERLRAGETAERVTAQSFLKAAQDRAAALDEELAQLRAAQAQVPAIEEQVHGLSRRLAAAAEAADAAQTQVTQLQTAVAEHEQRAAAQTAALADLDAQRAALEQRVQEALDTARARGEEAATLHAQVAELTPRAAQAAELQTALAAAEAARSETEAVIARLRQELLASHDQRTRAETALEQASAALATSEQDRATLGAALDQARAELATLAQAQTELTALREAHAAVEAALAARTQELETTRTTLTSDGQQQAAAAEAARARIAELEAEQAALATERAALRDAVAVHETALLERGEALAALQVSLDTARVEAAQGADAQRALAAQLAELESDLGAARAASERLTAELAASGEAQAALARERATLQERVSALAAGGQSLEQERQTAVAAAQQRTAALEAEISRLAATLESTRASASDEITRARHDAEATLDGLRVDLAETARARDELQRALATAQQECATQQRALAEMAAERARLEAAAERLHSERTELGARVSAAAADHAALAQTHGEAATRIATLEAELRRVRDEELAAAQAQLAAEAEARLAAERAAEAAASAHADEISQLRDQLAALGEEEARLSRQLAERDLLLQSAEENLGVLELAADGEEDGDVLAIDRDAAPAEADGAAVEPLGDAEATEAGELILLDAEEGAVAAARQLLEFGHRVSAVAPSLAAADALRQRTIAGAAVNLATPAAWGLIRQLRSGSGMTHTPLAGYALTAGQPKGFWLGPVDFAILPVTQLDLPAALNRLVPRVKRVLAMSNDIDVMSDVRTQLTAANVSTAVVLDGRQALDLVPTIRPEVAVLHLSPSCVDVFRAIAGLRAADISRDVPILFLLDAEPQPREEAFLSAGVRMLTSRGGLPADGLVDTLAAAFDACR